MWGKYFKFILSALQKVIERHAKGCLGGMILKGGDDNRQKKLKKLN